MLRLRKNKGQSTVEYAIIIGVIVAALIAMQTYVKRGLQARYHDGIQYLEDETNTLGTSTQYEPYYLSSQYDTSRSKTEQEGVSARGQTSRGIVGSESIQRASGGFEQYDDTTAD